MPSLLDAASRFCDSTAMKTYICLLLAACGPETQPVAYQQPQQPDMLAPIDICAPPAGQTSRSTPSQGYFAKGCARHCLPPEQAVSVCTARGNKYLNTRAGLAIPQSYVATWEIKTPGCLEYPWRVWRVEPVANPSDAAEGATTQAVIESDCAKYPIATAGYFAATRDRRFYKILGEVLLDAVE